MALDPSAPPRLVDAYNRIVALLGREPTFADVDRLLMAIVGTAPPQAWMDVNGDGQINIFDSILARQVIALIVPGNGVDGSRVVGAILLGLGVFVVARNA